MENLDPLRKTLTEAHKDLKLNIQGTLAQSKLSKERAYGCAIACALYLRSEAVSKALIKDAQAAGVAEGVIEDAKAASSIMAMNNVYYRFKHFMEEGGEYANERAGLRMNRLVKPAGEKVDFELFSLAASAVGGCEMCIKSHEKVVRDAGLSVQDVHEAVRIAAATTGFANAFWQSNLA